MKKEYGLIIISLLISLFIYLFYRTEKTVINQLFISLFSYNTYAAIKSWVTHQWPLPKTIINSLPEGLWVFCITLTSRNFFIKMGRFHLDLLFAPILFSLSLELLQLLHITNGRFDVWDIGLSILFWAVASFLIQPKMAKQNIMAPFNTRSLICVLSYLIVYLAHVWQ